MARLMTRTVFTAGLTAGYVLGARAGRERYDALARAARDVAQRPAVQAVAGLLRAQLSELFHGLVGPPRH